MTKREKANRTAIPVTKHRKAIGQFSERIWSNREKQKDHRNADHTTEDSKMTISVIKLFMAVVFGAFIVFVASAYFNGIFVHLSALGEYAVLFCNSFIFHFIEFS